jgi:hypothetical protein
MKKGPRCPVCGSLNIKEAVGVNPPSEAGLEKKEGENATGGNVVPSSGTQWKCGDCYRKFAVPDEITK